MKKQIAKTISILSLLVVLSVGAVNVSAFPICQGLSCKPNSAMSASAPKASKGSVQDLTGRETIPSAQPTDSFSFASLLVPWALSFLYLY